MKLSSALGLPQDDRVHAVDAGLEVRVRAAHGVLNELLLAPGVCAVAGEPRAEEHVHARVDDESVALLGGGLANRPEPLRLPVGIAQPAGGVVGVLEVAAGEPGAAQQRHELGRVHVVAGLGVDGHGHIDVACDARGRAEHVIARRIRVIFVAEHRGHPPAGRRDHRKPSRDHRSRRRDVPGVRKQQRIAGAVQRPQQVTPALESGRL